MRVDFQPSRKNLHAAPVGLPVEILERVNQAVRVHHNRLRTRLNLHPTMSSGSPCVIARRASSARPAWKNVPLKNRIPISVLNQRLEMAVTHRRGTPVELESNVRQAVAGTDIL